MLFSELNKEIKSFSWIFIMTMMKQFEKYNSKMWPWM